MVKTHGFPVELFQQNPQDWRLEASSTDLEGAVRQVDPLGPPNGPKKQTISWHDKKGQHSKMIIGINYIYK
jgi:hypothetical protein